jgi:hypothetical protein
MAPDTITVREKVRRPGIIQGLQAEIDVSFTLPPRIEVRGQNNPQNPVNP